MEPLWVNKDKLLSAYVLCYLDALINPHGVVNNPHGNQTHTHTHTHTQTYLLFGRKAMTNLDSST